MKSQVLSAVLSPALALLIGAIASPAESQAQRTVAEIVASVDGEPITRRDVEQFAFMAGQPANSDENFRAALKAVIMQKLLEKQMLKYSERIDESQVDRFIEEFRRDKGITDAQLKAEVANNGMSWDEFRRQARAELQRLMMLDQEVRQKVSISQEDIKAYYESHPEQFTATEERFRIAQVLIAAPPDADQAHLVAARARAEAVRKRALAGADLADLARAHSDDASRANGGELGWFKRDDILDEIIAAVEPLKPGDVSDVVHTRHGFHVLKLQGREEPGLRPLDDVSDQIRNRLLDEAARQRYQSWIDHELIKDHHVETIY
jgi:peptidyl-prolyl cis-trans isomerase SurA